MKRRELKAVGWREWVALPELSIKAIKAKIDTGARSSSLHAINLEFYVRSGHEYVQFDVHPDQRSARKTVHGRGRILEYRKVKSSNGQSELRPVIVTELVLLGERYPIELTLTNRDAMGFRLLLGRESLRKRFLVDSGRSYYGGKVKRKKK